MIFGTKDNKFVILGKTLDALREKLINFNDVTMQGGSLKNNKKQLIPENRLIGILSPEMASDIVSNLNTIKEGTNASYESFDEYFNILKTKGQGYVADYVKANQNQIYITKDVIKASENARKVQLDFNESIKQNTLSAKAGQVALKGLALAGNMLLSWGIGVAISLIASGISNLIHAQENAIKAGETALGTIKETRENLKSTKKTIDEVRTDYQALSQGVDELGRNVSLTGEQYDKYNSIVDKIAEKFPEMVQGYTAEGHAILKNKGNVEELTKAYEKQKKAAQDAVLVNSEVAFKGYNAKVNGTSIKHGSIHNRDVLNDYLKFDDMSSLYKKYGGEEEVRGALGSAARQLGSSWWQNPTSYLNEHKAQLKAYISQLNSEIESATAQIKPLAQAYLEQSVKFQGLPPSAQDAIQQAVNSFGYEFYSQFENAAQMNSWIDTYLVDTFKNNPELNQSFTVAMDMKTKFENNEVSYEDYITKLQAFKDILKALGFDENSDVIKNFDILLGIKSKDGSGYDADIKAAQKKIGKKYSGNIGSLTKEQLDALNSEDFEVDAKAIKSWDDIINKIDEYISKLDEVPKAPNIISTSDLSTAQDSISKLTSAFSEMNDNGVISMKTVADLQEAFKDVSGVEGYIKTLKTAKADSDEYKNALNGLMSGYLDTMFAGKELNDETEIEITNMLRAAGVTNASEIAHAGLAKAKINAKLKTFDFANATEEEIQTLFNEIKALGMSESAVNSLANCYSAAQTTMSNILALNAQSRLNILANELKGVKSVADAYNLIAGKTGSTTRTPAEMDRVRANYEMMDTPEARQITGVFKYASELEKIDGIISNFNNIQNSIGANFNYNPKSNSGGRGGNSGSEDKSNYESAIEAVISRIKKDSEVVNAAIEEIDNQLELIDKEDDPDKYRQLVERKLENQKKLDALYVAAQDKLHNEAEYLRNNGSYNASEWFDEFGNATEKYYEIYNSAASGTEQSRIKDLFDSIKKYKDAWSELQDSRQSAAKSILDSEKEIVECLEKELEITKTIADAHNDSYGNQKTNIEREISNIEHLIDLSTDSAEKTNLEGQLVGIYDKAIETAKLNMSKVHSDAEYWRGQLTETLLGNGLSFNISDWFSESGDILSQFEADMNTITDDIVKAEVQSYVDIISGKKSKYMEFYEWQQSMEKSIADTRKSYLNDLKDAVDELFDLRRSKLDSEQSLLEKYYNLTNSIAEEQHTLNKELLEADTTGARMNENERKLLFSKEEHSALSSKLNKILGEANALQKQYSYDLRHATKNTIEEITNNYERQYDLKMKEYEIVRAELELSRAEQKLENVKNEKSVRTWNGSKWVYEAVLQDVIDAQNDVEDKRYDLAQAKIQDTQQKALNKIAASNDALGTEQNKFADSLARLSGEVTDSRLKLTNALQNIADTDLSLFSEILSSVGNTLKNTFGVNVSAIKSKSQSGSGGKASFVLNAKAGTWTDTRTGKTTTASGVPSVSGWQVKPKKYAMGAKSTASGLALFDENGDGSEVIMTKYGKLRQFSQGETVFTKDATDRLYQIATNPYNPIAQMTNKIPDMSQYVRNDNRTQDNRSYSINGITIEDNHGKELLREVANYVWRKN